MIFTVAKVQPPQQASRFGSFFGLGQNKGLRNSLLLLLLLDIAVVFGLFQTRPTFEVRVGQAGDDSYVNEFYEGESNAQGVYRWSKSTSTADLPLVGSPFSLKMTATVVRPQTVTEPVRFNLKWDSPDLSQDFEVSAEQARRGQEAVYELQGGSQPSLDWQSGRLTINTDTFQPSKTDTRNLGLAVSRIVIQAQPNRLGLVIPPITTWLGWAIALVCLQACLALGLRQLALNNRGRVAVFWVVAVGLPMLLAIAFIATGPLLLLNPLVASNYFLLPGLTTLLWIIWRERANWWWAAVMATGTLAIFYGLVTFPALLLTGLLIVGLCLYHNLRLTDDQLNQLMVGIAAILANWRLLQMVQFVTDDAERHHYFWLNELDYLLRQGQVYPRWAEEFAYGHGNAVLNFYAPFSRYLAEVFVLGGLAPANAFYVALLIMNVVGGLGMYRLGRQWLGGIGALVAACVYVVNPYQLTSLYKRGSIGEAFAYNLLPWLVLALILLLKPNYSRPKAILTGAVTYGLIVLSHQLTGFFVIIFLVGPYLILHLSWAFWQSWSSPGGSSRVKSGLGTIGRGLLWVGATIVLGAGLSAFYLLPAFAESSEVWVSRLVRYPPEESLLSLSNIPRLTELISHIERVKAKDMDVSPAWIGVSFFILAGLGFGLALIRKAAPFWTKAAVVILIFLLAMQLDFTAPFWQNVPYMRFIEFPWRLMGFTAVFTAGLIGLLAEQILALLSQSRPRFAAFAAPAVALVLIGLLAISGSGDIVLRPSNDGRYSQAQIAAQFGDAYYLPVYVTTEGVDILTDQPTTYTQAYIEGDKAAQVKQERVGPNSYRITANLSKAGQLVIPIFYFPGWQLRDAAGQPLAISYNQPFGFITASLPAGSHTLALKIEDTPDRLAGWLLTLAALAIIGLLAAITFRKARAYK